MGLTKEQLRQRLTNHVRQPTYKRNPGHSVVAIYLGHDEWMTLADDPQGGARGISLRPDGICFDGVPVYRVDEKSHVRIVSEHKE